MKRVFLILASLIFVSSAIAETANEEAIILNQELQFLEDSVSSAAAAPSMTSTSASSVNDDEAANVDNSLERTYFSDAEKDNIRSKAAAPKRRSF
jgi:hypothetical protein